MTEAFLGQLFKLLSVYKNFGTLFYNRVIVLTKLLRIVVNRID